MAPGEISDEYEFFENMDKNSMYKAVITVQNGTALEASTADATIIDCHRRGFRGAEQKACVKFNKLISSLCSIQSSYGFNGLLNDNDYNYLKLWFILELKREGAIGNAYLDDFSFKTYKKIDGCFDNDIFDRILGYIYDGAFQKMKLLDKLYLNFFEIYDIFNSTGKIQIQNCFQYSNKCIEDYKNARKLCLNRSDYFYKALMRFKKTYKNFYADAICKDSSNAEYVLKLPGDYEIENLKFYTLEDETYTLILISLFTSVFAVFLILIYIYMFTPIGSRLRARRTNKNKKFRNQDDKNIKLLQFSVDSYDLGSNSRKYNLSYHST
ncbi:PIR protein [Plasmodium vivax]|uniref:VIR protein n=1 Tax=Plasmodium vivax TaxID=5855 RepID=A0A565A4A4_PLAVI|nr:PIR protein [Plasmodium vivax]